MINSWAHATARLLADWAVYKENYRNIPKCRTQRSSVLVRHTHLGSLFGFEYEHDPDFVERIGGDVDHRELFLLVPQVQEVFPPETVASRRVWAMNTDALLIKTKLADRAVLEMALVQFHAEHVLLFHQRHERQLRLDARQAPQLLVDHLNRLFDPGPPAGASHKQTSIRCPCQLAYTRGRGGRLRVRHTRVPPPPVLASITDRLATQSSCFR